MKYKGYSAAVEFSDGDDCFHGRILHISDVVSFEGSSVRELKKAFRDSVDDYLVFCSKRGREPERPFSGKFLVRIPPELHREISRVAQRQKKSLNTWILEALQSSVEGHELRASPRQRVRAT